MPYQDNYSNILDSARRRIEDVLFSLDVDKLIPERYRQRTAYRDLLHLDDDLEYTNEIHNTIYPLMYNLFLNIEDYSNDSKPLYKSGFISYLVDGKKVKFFYEKTENKISNPSAIYDTGNKKISFNANVINSMDEESLTKMLKFVSVLNYIAYFKQ
ncbi:MAG: hypothetical protein ACP5MV_03805 [Candidatus Parvarchaeum sp.]